MSGERYTREHEYVRVDGDVGVIGITDYAQAQLGDIVFVELPAPGKRIAKGEQLAAIESVKAASEVYAPISGEVVEVNAELEAAPASVNEDPLGKGWFLKLRITDAAELDGLLDQAGYEAFLASLG